MSKTTIKITHSYSNTLPYHEEVVINSDNAITYDNKNIYSDSIIIEGNLTVEIGSPQYNLYHNGLSLYGIKNLLGYYNSTLSKITARDGATVNFDSSFYGNKPIDVIIKNGAKLSTNEADHINISTVTMEGKGKFVCFPNKKLNVPASYLETEELNKGIMLPFNVASELPLLFLFLDNYKKHDIDKADLLKVLRTSLSTSFNYAKQNIEELSTTFGDKTFSIGEINSFYDDINASENASLIGSFFNTDFSNIFSTL